MPKGVNNTTLGTYVRTRRRSRDMDVRTCVEHSGFHESYWYKLEAGQYDSPEPKHLRIIAETIGCPLADLYALCGYDTPTELPTLTPYLRTKYDLPPEAVADMEKYFTQLRAYYGIPDDQPVFPEPPATETTASGRRAPSGSRNSESHPWRASVKRRKS